MAVVHLLDTSALLTLSDDEPGADRVEQVLEAPQPCYACFLMRMEVGATLLHKDPEFRAIADLSQEWLG